MVRSGTEDGSGAQRGDDDTRMVVAPLRHQPLDLGRLDRRRVPGDGRQRRGLGDRDRVGGPGPVDHRRRDAHDPPDAGPGRGVEETAGAVDVDPRHERVVGDGVDDPRQVDDHVGPGQDGVEVGAGEVDPPHHQAAPAAGRSLTSRPTTLVDGGRRVEERQQVLGRRSPRRRSRPREAVPPGAPARSLARWMPRCPRRLRCAPCRSCAGRTVHRLTAWTSAHNPATTRSPEIGARGGRPSTCPPSTSRP